MWGALSPADHAPNTTITVPAHYPPTYEEEDMGEYQVVCDYYARALLISSIPAPTPTIAPR
jgi:hypothetical protein